MRSEGRGRRLHAPPPSASYGTPSYRTVVSQFIKNWHSQRFIRCALIRDARAIDSDGWAQAPRIIVRFTRGGEVWASPLPGRAGPPGPCAPRGCRPARPRAGGSSLPRLGEAQGAPVRAPSPGRTRA